MTDRHPHRTLAPLSALVAALVLAAPLSAQMDLVEEAPAFTARTFVWGGVFDTDSDQLGLDVQNYFAVGLDLTYFFTPNLAANLLVAVASPAVETADGADLGSVDALPPALTLQYHFLPRGRVRPYVGVGGDYMNFFGVSGELDTGLDVEIEDAFGIVGQGGVNIMATEVVSVIADFRWISILNDPEVRSAGTVADQFSDFNVAVISLGLGFSL